MPFQLKLSIQIKPHSYYTFSTIYLLSKLLPNLSIYISHFLSYFNLQYKYTYLMCHSQWECQCLCQAGHKRTQLWANLWLSNFKDLVNVCKTAHELNSNLYLLKMHVSKIPNCQKQLISGYIILAACTGNTCVHPCFTILIQSYCQLCPMDYYL